MPLIAETYLAGKDYTVTLNGYELAVEDGSFWSVMQTDEMTNNKTGGYYEDVGTTKQAGLSGMRAVYEKATAPPFKSGDIVACEVRGAVDKLVDTEDIVHAGPRFVGNVRIGRMEYPTLTVKGGLRYSFDATSQGPFVVTHEVIPPPAP